MYLTPSVPNLCTLIQYLSVLGSWVSNLAISCPTGLCEPVLLVLTLVCFISNFAVNYLLSLHTAETNLLRPGTSHPCIPLQILQRSLAIVTLR